MPAGVELYNYVLNQLGSPALYSDILANRPAFGFTGRLFISTDTNEIYRDTGTSWVLISGGGASVNIYNSNGSLTGTRTMTMAGYSLTFAGGASPANLILDANANVNRDITITTAGVNRWDIIATDNETGSSRGSNLYLKAYNDAGAYMNDAWIVRRATQQMEFYSVKSFTTPGLSIDGFTGYYFSGTQSLTGSVTLTGNPQGVTYTIYTFSNNGNPTFTNSNIVGANQTVTRFSGANGNVTLNQTGAGIRAMGNVTSYTQFSLTNNATVSHFSNLALYGIDDIGGLGGILTFTNAYSVVINDLDEYGEIATGKLVLTNRWGIYQGGALDVNYFNANTLFGTTTNAGYKVDVSGTARVTQSAYFATSSGNVGIGTTTATDSSSFGKALDLQGANGAAIYIRYSTDPTNQFATVGYDRTGIGLALSVNNALPISFYTNNSQRMRIFPNGNVRIGSTFTDNGFLFQVGGQSMVVGEGGTGSNDAFLVTNAGSGVGAESGLITQLNSSNAAYIFSIPGKHTFQTVNTNPFEFLTSGSATILHISNSRNVGISQTTFGTGGTQVFAIATGATPSSSPADCFQLYSQDITAGNAAAHFRTENGAIIKVYQETTAVGSATVSSPGAGSIIKTDDTFDGYTLQQVVKALRNLGLLA